jgi:hypothetical protein
MLTAVAAPAHDAPIAPAHADFLARLRLIELHARFAFRNIVCPQERHDAVAEVVALVWKWYCRLLQRGKDPSAFVVTLAQFAARHVKAGRRLCGNLSSKDVLSRLAQKRRGFQTVRLQDNGAYDDPAWQEALHDDLRTPVPDQVAFRIDFPEWLALHGQRDRRLIEDMATGESTTQLARKYGVTQGRIAQKRRQFRQDWERFAGEPVAGQPERAAVLGPKSSSQYSHNSQY